MGVRARTIAPLSVHDRQTRAAVSDPRERLGRRVYKPYTLSHCQKCQRTEKIGTIHSSGFPWAILILEDPVIRTAMWFLKLFFDY